MSNESFGSLQKICLIKKTEEQIMAYFEHETSTSPMSIFNEYGEMWKSVELAFYDFFIQEPKQSYVVWLVMRNFWKLFNTLSQMC